MNDCSHMECKRKYWVKQKEKSAYACSSTSMEQKEKAVKKGEEGVTKLS